MVKPGGPNSGSLEVTVSMLTGCSQLKAWTRAGGSAPKITHILVGERPQFLGHLDLSIGCLSVLVWQRASARLEPRENEKHLAGRCCAFYDLSL